MLWTSPFRARRPAVVVGVAVVILTGGSLIEAQTLEIMPLAGYRFGGDIFELATGGPLDADGAPAAGAVVNIQLGEGMQIEALYTHQRARVTAADLLGNPLRWEVIVDHWQAGGLQELHGSPRVRPFLTGLLGLSRYAIEGDNELRFVVSGGGGVKLFPARHLGVRLDGRLFATFADIDGRATACSVGRCLIALNVDVVWQAEFTAGVVLRFH
jgi:hypothetical protein